MEHDVRVLLLTGPPGAGKSTVARLLVSRFQRAVHLPSDEFFHFIRAGYVEPWKPESHEQNRVAMSVVADAAITYARAGYFTIVDGILIPGWFYEPVHAQLGWGLGQKAGPRPRGVPSPPERESNGGRLTQNAPLRASWREKWIGNANGESESPSKPSDSIRKEVSAPTPRSVGFRHQVANYPS